MKRLKEDRKKVLVTGAYGYIGSLLVKELEKIQVDFLAVDKVHGAKPNSICFDLQNSEQTSEYIKNFRPDFFIHLATHSALSYQNQFLNSFKEDFLVLSNILEALFQTPNCRLLYFSSSYVYSGLSNETQVIEESRLRPGHNFGIAKAFFEQFLLKHHPNSVIFRLFSVFGPGNYLFPNSVHNMVQECKEKGALTIWGEGNRKIQYVFVKDVLRYIPESFFIEPGIYNLGGNEYLSTSDAAKIIAEMFGAKTVFLKDKREGEMLPFGKNKKLREATGKEYYTPFAQALKEYL